MFGHKGCVGYSNCETKMAIATVNPATGETVRTFDELSDRQLETKLEKSSAAFETFRKGGFEARAGLLIRAAKILDTEQEALARLITLEMGKPIVASRAEVAKCANVCRYYAENGARHLEDEVIKTSASRSFVRYEPMGAVLAVMPWNFPFWQVFRFAAPTLMAGNVAVLKHASNVPQCAVAIEDVFVKAGFEEGVFQTLLIASAKVAALLDDPRVRAATLTGSEGAGSDVASRAGKKIKKVVLELGGSDPFIVMPSADLDEAVKTGVKARMVNGGQSCIAAKRFIVHQDVAGHFEERFVAAMKSLVVGDPMKEETEVGPMALSQIVDELEKQVSQSVAAGARLLTGGRRMPGAGYWFEPTVLSGVPAEAPASREEVFGPVASMFRVASVEEAIALANRTEFGLGSSVWTRDETEMRAMIGGLEAGQVFVNAMVASDPRLPFGGVKQSGFGRELGELGIREFVNVKTVWVQ